MQKIQKEFRGKLMYSCFVKEDRDTDQVQNKKICKIMFKVKNGGLKTQILINPLETPQKTHF